MALGIFDAAFEKRSLPPYTRVRWRGMVRCGASATKARKSPKQVSPVTLYASASLAYDGTGYSNLAVAR